MSSHGHTLTPSLLRMPTPAHMQTRLSTVLASHLVTHWPLFMSLVCPLDLICHRDKTRWQWGITRLGSQGQGQRNLLFSSRPPFWSFYPKDSGSVFTDFFFLCYTILETGFKEAQAGLELALWLNMIFELLIFPRAGFAGSASLIFFPPWVTFLMSQSDLACPLLMSQTLSPKVPSLLHSLVRSISSLSSTPSPLYCSEFGRLALYSFSWRWYLRIRHLYHWCRVRRKAWTLIAPQEILPHVTRGMLWRSVYLGVSTNLNFATC